MGKRAALIYLVPEGVNTWVAGVGSVINGNLQALPGVVEDLWNAGVDLTLFFCTPAAGPGVRGWNPSQFAKARQVAEATGGQVVLLPNLTDGSENFGRLDQWKVVSGAGAGFALATAGEFDKTVVLAHSSHPFALAPVIIDMQHHVYGVDITTVYTIHSTAIQDRTLDLRGGKFPDQERIMVEALAIQWAKFTNTIRLGCISEYMGRHLVEQHGADPRCLVPTRNGIDTSDPHFALLPEERKLAILEGNGVPIDRPLFFSWGRFVPEKGFDLFLELARRLDGALHPVIVGMVDHSPSYPDEIIRQYRGTVPGGETIIVKRDWELVTAILQWKNTRLVGILSRYDEPHGLVVNEARYHARAGGPVVMVSNRGGLPEQITPGEDGLVADIDRLDRAVEVAREFLNWSEEKREQVRRNALVTMEKRFSFRRNIVETLRAAMPLPS